MSRAGRHGASARGTERETERGFTLIELLVVLTLIALMATLATPMLRNSLPGLELKTAAEDIRGALRRARAEAIRDNREAAVLVDVSAGSWAIEGGKEKALPPGMRMELTTARSELLEDGRGRIRFYPDGTSTGGAVLIESAGGIRKVAVDWFDGRVSIGEPDAG